MTTLEQWDAANRPAGIEVEHVHDELADLGAPPIERWRILDDEAAAWCLRRLATATARKRANIDLARSEHERIDLWLEDVNGPVEHKVQFYAGALRDYAHRRVMAELDAHKGDWQSVEKTLKLRGGEVAARRSNKGRFENYDQDAVVGCLSDLGLADRLLDWRPTVQAKILDNDPIVGCDLTTGRYAVWAQLPDGAPDSDRIDPALLDVLGHPYDGEQPPDGFVAGWIVLPGVRRTGIGEITYTVTTSDGDR